MSEGVLRWCTLCLASGVGSNCYSFLHIWGPLLPREGPDTNAAGWVARVGCGGEGTRSAQLVADEVDTAAPRRRWALGRERAWPRGKGREGARRNLWGGTIPIFQALPERNEFPPLGLAVLVNSLPLRVPSPRSTLHPRAPAVGVCAPACWRLHSHARTESAFSLARGGVCALGGGFGGRMGWDARAGHTRRETSRYEDGVRYGGPTIV